MIPSTILEYRATKGWGTKNIILRVGNSRLKISGNFNMSLATVGTCKSRVHLDQSYLSISDVSCKSNAWLVLTLALNDI